MVELIIIAAIAENNVIGSAGRLPWHLPEDLKHFRSITINYPIIMGRKTFESIGKPLDKRKNIVITHQRNYAPDGIAVVHSMKEALEECAEYGRAFVIGGRSVFEESLPLAKRLELTRIHKRVEGDVFFPEIDFTKWQEIRREDHTGFSFITYRRK